MPIGNNRSMVRPGRRVEQKFNSSADYQGRQPRMDVEIGVNTPLPRKMRAQAR